MAHTTTPVNVTPAEAVAAMAAHGSRAAAAEALGISRRTIGRLLDRACDEPQATDDNHEHEPEHGQITVELDASDDYDLEILRLRDRCGELEQRLRRQQREAIDAQQIREAIFELRAMDLTPPAWTVDPAAVRRGTAGIPVTVWSDWHYGEYVSREETGGLNSYSLEIADRRIDTLVERTIDVCMHHTPQANSYSGIVVCLGGDLVSGDIHAELREANELQSAPTVVRLARKVASALKRMADVFGKVAVFSVVGNHGRLTIKPQAKGRVHTNWEWLLFNMIELSLCGDDRIRLIYNNDTDVHFKVFNRRYMLTHGDALGVKGGDGIIGAIGPIMRGTLKVRNSEAQIGRDIDTLILGHWHQQLWLPGCVVNGTIKGYDEFCRLFLRAPFSAPTQGLWFSHPERGITSRWEIQVDAAAAQQDGSDWVSWRNCAA